MTNVANFQPQPLGEGAQHRTASCGTKKKRDEKSLIKFLSYTFTVVSSQRLDLEPSPSLARLEITDRDTDTFRAENHVETGHYDVRSRVFLSRPKCSAGHRSPLLA